MWRFTPLRDYLECWAGGDAERLAVAETIRSIADAGREISRLVARVALAGALGAAAGDVNADGDVQMELDLRAHEILMAAFGTAPVALILSEELTEPKAVDLDAELVVALDPLDGSSNIDTNVSVGTIFSVLVGNGGARTRTALLPGHRQRAAGYVIYGPQTSLVMTIGEGTQLFTLDPDSGEFLLTKANLQIPQKTREFAINASNFRHWDEYVRAYVDDCLAGETGPRGVNYNMRWIASLVAECHRILMRGGVFLYPADKRPGYANGRLRLIYEANPIAWLVEQAGGGASTGRERILDIQPSAVHQRVPLIFGSADKVARIDGYYADLDPLGRHSPLFGQRGLFRG
jgi:fructose-1,6-bisphosphatase I